MEDSSVRLGDGTTRIFLNTKGVLEQEDISEDLKAFLEYVEGNETENAFVQRVADELECEVEEIRDIYAAVQEYDGNCSTQESMEKLK